MYKILYQLKGVTYVKKRIIWLLTIIFISLFHSLVWSSVEGIWDVNGTLTVQVSIPGEGSDKITVPFSDVFIFYPDNSFEMTNINGTWTHKKKKFKVFLNADNIKSYFEDYFWDYYDLDITCEITKAILQGTENAKKATIKGKMSLKMNVYFWDYDVEGKIKISANFTGGRSEISDLVGTYTLSGFTIRYSNGIVVTQNDVSYFSGTMSITNNTITQFIEIEEIDIYASGTYTTSFFNKNEGILHINDVSGSHDVYFTISGNYLNTYSGIINLGNGLMAEEWDYWEKISNSPTITTSALSVASKNIFEKQIDNNKGLFTAIGESLK